MADELSDELDVGGEAARAVVEHLLRMGAGTASIPVTVDGRDYLVSVEPVPLTPSTLVAFERKN